EVLKLPTKKEGFFKAICPIIQKNTDSERPGLTAGQFYRFYYEIKQNDIVIIPSESSKLIAIGRVLDVVPEAFEFQAADEKLDCDHVHTRNIDWLAIETRNEFNPNFISLLFSHNAIVDATDYKDYINGVLHDFFIQENTGHLLINIKSNESIKARTLFLLFIELLDLTDDFFDELSSPNDINIRINLNSPGKVELISKNIYKLSLAGMIIVGIAGGHFKIGNDKNGNGIAIGTDGMLKPILSFINKKNDRRAKIELVTAALDDLNIEKPRELAAIIQEYQVSAK
ncbi:hypothetical protein VU11_05450, partial [Desulfobulbus sp. US2]|nr:hypothetical protein [Desulfobulbus sp. US2]